MSGLVETRTPDAIWVLRVESVPARAKTGYDWSGSWLRPGKLVDLPAGTLIAACYRNRRKSVYLNVLDRDGRWLDVVGGHVEDDEWAYHLRSLARALQGMSPDERLLAARGAENPADPGDGHEAYQIDSEGKIVLNLPPEADL